MNKPTTSALWLCFLNVILSSLGEETMTPQPTISPVKEFIASPQNLTVLEGNSAVLRCKIKDRVHNCQWFYLKFGLDMLQPGNDPILVKEFRPQKNDCSIKFSKVRLIQGGQWICKGLQIHARKYVVSRPANLQVIARIDNSTGQSEPSEPNENENDVSVDITFHLTDEGHIINTKLGDSAVLACQTNKQLTSCSWIRPDGTTLRFNEDAKGNYVKEGNYTEGNCSLRINEVTARDEGNWRCVVSVNAKGDKLGPLIHLHVEETGAHTDNLHSSTDSPQGSSLIIILVITSLVLLIIIIALVCYMYKRVWQRNSPPHKYLESNKSETSDYSNYGPGWLSKSEKEQKLMDESTEKHPHDENPSVRYLDMSGNKHGEGYIMFPASSVRSSMSSRTTISTIPVGQNAIIDTDNSARTSASDSLHSVSTFGKSSPEKENIQKRELPKRSESVYSHGHLYEEIDETRMRRKLANEDQADYANIDEDQEGYMIPKECPPAESITMTEITNTNAPTSSQPLTHEATNQTKAPPYSKVGENGLVPDSDDKDFVTNPTYSGNEPEESYDAPSAPPIPIRNDSADNPLAAYDVPNSASKEVNVLV